MRASVLACSAFLFAAPAARAYRPFDGTDADVAERGKLEIEFGPVGFLKTGSNRFMVVPDLIFNLGFAEGWELVLEGRQELLLDPQNDTPSLRITDTQLNLKTVVRAGELQEQTGPSVAVEAGILLPTVNDEPGVGAQVTVIGSRRWAALTAHLNLGATLSRDKHLELPGSLILEGPWKWTVRPVSELFWDFRTPDQLDVSGLGGLIWRASEMLAVDAGFRAGRESGQTLLEVRLGLTIALNVPWDRSAQVASSGQLAHLPSR